MPFHPLCYSVSCLDKKIILNFQDFSYVVNGNGSRTLSVMPWISQAFEIKSVIECFLGSRWQIYLDRNRNSFFRKQPDALFFKRATIASLRRETQITNLNNKRKMKITNLATSYLTCSLNTFVSLFCCRFLLPWRHLSLPFIL